MKLISDDKLLEVSGGNSGDENTIWSDTIKILKCIAEYVKYPFTIGAAFVAAGLIPKKWFNSTKDKLTQNECPYEDK